MVRVGWWGEGGGGVQYGEGGVQYGEGGVQYGEGWGLGI